MKYALLVLFALVCFVVEGLAQVNLVAPEGAPAFPSSAAGISAYVKVDRPIRIDEALAAVFHRIVDVGDNYIIGTVEVKNFVSTVYPHVYVDTEGWIVAFLLASEPAALIMHWSGDCNNPTPTIKTTLEVALETVAAVARVPVSKPSFFDFSNPTANTMLILLRVLPTPDTKVMYVKLPTTYTVYTFSYFHYGCNYYVWPDRDEWFGTVLKLNGAVINRLEGTDTLSKKYENLPSRDLKVNILHEFELSYSHSGAENGSAGVAIVIIYRAQ